VAQHGSELLMALLMRTWCCAWKYSRLVEEMRLSPCRWSSGLSRKALACQGVYIIMSNQPLSHYVKEVEPVQVVLRLDQEGLGLPGGLHNHE
jgi:hypothetical protein